MTRLRTAPQRASELGPNNKREAAKLYNDIVHELELGDPSRSDEDSGQAAMRILESNFPGVATEAQQIETPPRLSRRANQSLGHLDDSHSDGRRRRANPSAQRHNHGHRQPSSGDRGSPRPRATSSARGRAGAGRHASSPARQTIRYVDRGASIVTGDSASGWGELILDVFLGGVILSLAYLLITHAKGPSELFNGGSKLVASVIHPTTDPLNPHLGVA